MPSGNEASCVATQMGMPREATPALSIRHQTVPDPESMPTAVGMCPAATTEVSRSDPVGGFPVSECLIPTDPFDPTKLRLSQDFTAELGVKKKLLTVPVRKPDKAWFVRVHPDEKYRLPAAVLELKEERELYLVNPEILKDLAGETAISPRTIFTAVNRQGVIFLWPVRLPGTDGKLDDWSHSAQEAARLTMGSWVRVQANMSLVAYDVFQAVGKLPEPQWPEESFSELLKVGF